MSALFPENRRKGRVIRRIFCTGLAQEPALRSCTEKFLRETITEKLAERNLHRELFGAEKLF